MVGKMALADAPDLRHFELRDAASAAPRVEAGHWTKVGVRGERFWCRVKRVDPCGRIVGVVGNELILNAWPLGGELTYQHRHVLESVNAVDLRAFRRHVDSCGSVENGALEWHDQRISVGKAVLPKSGGVYMLGKKML